jgi:integrase
MRSTAKKTATQLKKPKSEKLPGKVRISEVTHPYHTHIVYFPADGKRAFKWFNNRTQALDFANEKSAEAGEVGKGFGSISEPERAAIAHWRQFVASVPDCPPPALLAILQDYATRHKATKSSVTVSAAVEAYEAAKTAEGLRGVSLAAIHARCARFVADFGDRSIASITTPEISDWILSLAAVNQPVTAKRKGTKDAPAAQVSLLTKKNHRLALSGLFNFAKGRGWLTNNPVAESAKPKPPKTRPGILRPGEVSRFFGALVKAAPAMVPFWAVRFFGGVREQECLRMDWSMIDLAACEINLPDGATKTGHSRTVKIEPALAAFLAPHKQPDGRIVTNSAMGRIYWTKKALRLLQSEDAAAALAKQAGNEPPRPFPVPMPDNAARHSFATFHLLAFRHAGETAIQLGHGQSPELLHRHYKGIATEAEGKEFWEIRPAAIPANVIPISQPAEIEAPAANRKAAR